MKHLWILLTVAGCDGPTLGSVASLTELDASTEVEATSEILEEAEDCPPDDGFCGVCSAFYPQPGPPNVVVVLSTCAGRVCGGRCYQNGCSAACERNPEHACDRIAAIACEHNP